MATEKTVKVANYSAEQTAEIISAYLETPTKETVESLAESMGKTVRSIVAKLSREKVYIKAEYKTKAGETVVKKDSLIDKLADLIPMTEAEQSSFAHVNKTALVKLIAAITPVAAEEVIEAV